MPGRRELRETSRECRTRDPQAPLELVEPMDSVQQRLAHHGPRPWIPDRVSCPENRVRPGRPRGHLSLGHAGGTDHRHLTAGCFPEARTFYEGHPEAIARLGWVPLPGSTREGRRERPCHAGEAASSCGASVRVVRDLR